MAPRKGRGHIQRQLAWRTHSETGGATSNGLEEAPRAHSSVKCAKMAWSLLIEMVGIFGFPGKETVVIL